MRAFACIRTLACCLITGTGVSAAELPPKDGRKCGDVLTVDLGGDAKLDLVWVPAGKFLMGSPEAEAGRDKNEGPQHEVTLTKGFWVGRHLVTQAQWERVTGSNPSQFKGPALPVETVSWNDCQDFLRALNERHAVPGHEFRLPTEAQWEYACRAGTTTRFHFGDDADPSMANFVVAAPAGKPGDGKPDDGKAHGGNAAAPKGTTAVGTYKPNAWGLYDMHGNLSQWCADGINGYRKGPATDPVNPPGHPVLRGGSWADDAAKSRSAKRWRDPVATKKDKIGFRVVLVERQPAAERGPTEKAGSGVGP